MITKQNDWIAANLNAPEGTSLLDMYASGITPDNTAMNSRDFYKNIPQVQQTFLKDDGITFDEEAFNSFYDSALRTFNDYADQDFIERTIEQMNRSPYDWTNLDNPNILDTSAYLTNIKDKNRTTMGTGNIWQTGDPVYSDREVAQANYVRDEEGNVLDWTANDRGGVLKNLFRPTLVLATWDEDGTHFENGKEVQHFKGETKLDWKGDPYTEILGDREYYGKDVVKWSDILTKEDTWLNKIDPFDSDGIEKSIGATIAEIAVKTAPFLIPGAGPYLGYAIAAKELTAVMPTFLKAMNGLFGGDNDSMFGKKMNEWESYMDRYRDSMSDKGKANFWNFENLGNVITSSFGQLTSQRSIAQIPKLLGNPTIRSSKVGQQMALTYMALTSSKDTYSQFKAAGAEDWVAGAGMLGTMGMYYGLMSIGYFKKWLFRDSWLGDDVEFKRSFNALINETAKQLNLTAPKSAFARKMLANNVMNTVYTKGSDLLKKFTESKFGQGLIDGLAHSGLNEGFEEVTEEFGTDIVKALALGLEALGVKVTEDPLQKLDFRFDPKEMLQRYAASFVGGFIGGTIFKGYEWYDNLQHGQAMIHNIQDLNKRLAWYDRNGYYDKALQMLERMHDKHELPADINKSILDFAEVDNLEAAKYEDNSKIAFLSANDPKRSQHEYLYQVVKGRLMSVHEALEQHLGTGMLMNDEDLNKAVWNPIEEAAKSEGISVDEYTKRELIDHEIEALHASGFFNLAVTEANNLLANVYNADLEIKKLSAKLAKTESETEQKLIKKQISDAEKVLKEYVEDYEAIVKGERAPYYVASAYYRTNNDILKAYLNNGEFNAESTFFPETDIHHYVWLNYGINYDSLSETAKKLYNDEFNKFQEDHKNEWELRLWRMMRLQYALSKNHAKAIQKVADATSGYTLGKTFEPSYFQDYWKNMSQQVDALSNVANLDELKEILHSFENKNFSNLSDEDFEILNSLVGGTINKENPIEIIAALQDIQRQLHVLEHLSEYEAVTTWMESNKLSIDQTMSPEGFQQWGEILKLNSLDSDSEAIMQLEMLKELYTKMSKDKIISPGESALFRMVMSRHFDIAKPVIDQWLRNNTGANPMNENESESEAYEHWIGEWKSKDNPSFSELGEVILYDTSLVDQIFRDLVMNKISELKDALLSGKSVKIQKWIDDFKSFILTPEIYQELDQNGNRIVTDDFETDFNTWKEVFNVDAFVDKLINPVKNLIKYVEETEPLLNVVDQSPVLEFLDELSLDINGKRLKIMDIILDTEEAIGLVDRVEDLQIEQQTLRELHDAKHLLDIAIVLFEAAYKDPKYGGTSINDRINSFGESFASTDNNFLGKQLNVIKNRLQAIIDLIEQNIVSTTEEQKRIAVNVYPKLIKSLINPSVDDEDSKTFTSKLSGILGTSGNILYKLWNDVGGMNIDSVTGNNYKEFEQVTRKWMSKVRETLLPMLRSEHSVSEDSEITFWKNVGNKFGEVFGDGLGNMLSTKLSSQTKSVTLYDSVNLLLSIIGSDSNDFYSKLKALFEREKQNDKSFLPYFGQELNIFIGWARRKNHDLFNAFNSHVTKKSENPDDEFVKGITSLDNFTMVDGSSGVGKSTGIAYYLSELLKIDGDTVISTSTLKDRFEALGKTLKSNSIAINTILEAIYGGKKTNKVYTVNTYVKERQTKEGSHVLLQEDFKLPEKFPESLKSVFGNDPSKVVLFIDEITLLHAGELKILSEFAKKFGITLQGLGDLKQPSAKFSNDLIAGLENFVYTKGPSLKASLRITNKGMRRNKTIIEGLLDDVLDAYALHPEWKSEDINKNAIEKFIETRRQNNENDLFNLMYHSDDSGIYGLLYSSTPENYVDSLLEIAKKNKEKIVIVYDKKTEKKYSKWQDKEGIELVHADKVQGGEWDYVIIDCDLTVKNEDKLGLLRKFNMLTGRAKVGTVVGYSETNDVRKQFLKGTTIFNSYDDASAKKSLHDPNSAENKHLRKEFIDWRMDNMSDVTPAKIVKENPSPSPLPAPSPAPSPSPAPVSRPKTIKPESKITKDEIIKEEFDKPESDKEGAPDKELETYTNDVEGTKGPYLARRQKIVNSSSNVVDCEENFKLIWNLSDAQIDNLISFEFDKTNSNYTAIKRMFQIISGYILDVDSKEDNKFVITEGFKTSLKKLDPTDGRALSSYILTALEDNTNSFYKYTTFNDSTIISWCLLNKKEIAAIIPIAHVNKALGNGVYKNIGFTERMGTLFVSSKGRMFTNVNETLGEKFWFPDGKKLGIFAATTEERQKYSVKLWSGKAFFPLLLPHQLAKLGSVDEYFRSSQYGNTTKKRVSKDGQWSLKVPIPGVQKIVDFQKCMELWNQLVTLNKHRVGKNAEPAKEALRPYYGRVIDEVTARPSEVNETNHSGAPKPLTSKQNLGRLFTALMRYFENTSDSEKSNFYNKLFELKFSYLITDNDGNKLYTLERTDSGFKVKNLKTDEYLKEKISLKNNTFNPELLLETLGLYTNKSEPNPIKTDQFRFTPIYFTDEGKYFISYDYRVFPEIIKNDVNLWKKIDDFLKSDSYFNYNIFLAIYASSDYVNNEKLWKLTDVKNDEEFVWDIVETLLPVYSVTSGELIINHPETLNKVDVVFTPKSEIDDSKPSMEIQAGTSYKKENSDYVIYVGNTPSEIIVNQKWIDDFLEEKPSVSGTISISRFNNTSIYVKEGGAEVSYKFKDGSDFIGMLKSKYVSEQVGVTPGKVKIDGKEYSVSNITSDSIKLDNIDFVIVSSTDSQLGLYNKDFNGGSVFYIDNAYDGIENNIRDQMEYLGKDDSYLYFKLNDENKFYAWSEDNKAIDAENMIEVQFNMSSGSLQFEINSYLIPVPQTVLDKINMYINSQVIVNGESKLVWSDNKFKVTGITVGDLFIKAVCDTNQEFGKQVAVVEIDFNNKKLVVNNGKNITLDLKSHVTLETLGNPFTNSVDKESLHDPRLIDLKKQIKSARIFKFDVNNLSDIFEEALEQINAFFEAEKYNIGHKYEFKVDEYNRVQRIIDSSQEKQLAIGKSVKQLLEEANSSSVFEISDITRNDRNIKDFWVTLDSGKYHYQLVHQEDSSWKLREVSTEEMIENNDEKIKYVQTIQQFVESYTTYVTNIDQKIKNNFILDKQLVPKANSIFNTIMARVNEEKTYSDVLDLIDELYDQYESSSNEDVIEFVTLLGKIAKNLGDVLLEQEGKDWCKI